MELVKIHGGEDKVEMPKNVPQMNLDDSDQPFHGFENSEPIDAGAVEHSSDSDYEPPGSDALLQTAEKHLLGKFECQNADFYVIHKTIFCVHR